MYQKAIGFWIVIPEVMSLGFMRPNPKDYCHPRPLEFRKLRTIDSPKKPLI